MFDTIKKLFRKEESLSEHLAKRNAYDRWFAGKYQDALKKRYFKLLQDLNDFAHQNGFGINIELMKEDVEDRNIDFYYIEDIERMIISDFYGSVEDICAKLQASSSGKAEFFLGITMLKLTKIDEKAGRIMEE